MGLAPPDVDQEEEGGQITLTFGLGHRVENQRIAKAVEPAPGRWTNHVLIDDESDFTDEVRGWLREAYENSPARSRLRDAHCRPPERV